MKWNKIKTPEQVAWKIARLGIRGEVLPERMMVKQGKRKRRRTKDYIRKEKLLLILDESRILTLALVLVGIALGLDVFATGSADPWNPWPFA